MSKLNCHYLVSIFSVSNFTEIPRMDELGQDIEIDDIIDTRFDFGLSEEDVSARSPAPDNPFSLHLLDEQPPFSESVNESEINHNLTLDISLFRCTNSRETFVTHNDGGNLSYNNPLYES